VTVSAVTCKSRSNTLCLARSFLLCEIVHIPSHKSDACMTSRFSYPSFDIGVFVFTSNAHTHTFACTNLTVAHDTSYDSHHIHPTHILMPPLPLHTASSHPHTLTCSCSLSCLQLQTLVRGT
jgi:hypothetical protein